MLVSLLIVFVGTLVATQVITREESPVEVAEPTPLRVKGFAFGDTTVSERSVGVVENLTTTTLVAQSAGPVKSVEVVEGDQVWRGEILLRQESAYASGNAPAVQYQIAQQNAVLADTTLENTVETVAKTREQADAVRSQTEELRKLSEKAIDDTRGVISTAETQVEALESLIASAGTESEKATFRGSLLAAQGTLNSNRASLRSLEFETDTDNEPSKLADIAKDLVYKSTEIQLESAKIQKEIAHLNVRLAGIQVAATRVAAPYEATVQRVLVQPGDYVTPGQPVMILTGEAKLCLKISVSGSLASQVDESGQLQVTLGNQVVSLPVNHVSSTPTNGTLFEVLSIIPAEHQHLIYENQALDVLLPLYSVSIAGGNYSVPLDSVFITSTDTFVFVGRDGQAVKTSVQVGEITGSTIEVVSGLDEGDVVIADRRVTAGQKVEVQLQDDVVISN